MNPQRVLNANIPYDIQWQVAIILAYEPFSDKKYKIYKKLDSNQKTGMLIRHIMSIYKKHGGSDDLLEVFLISKDDYKFYSNYYKELKEKYKGEKDTRKLIEMLKIEVKYFVYKRIFSRNTKNLILTLFKNKNFKEHCIKVNKHKEKIEKTCK